MKSELSTHSSSSVICSVAHTWSQIHIVSSHCTVHSGEHFLTTWAWSQDVSIGFACSSHPVRSTWFIEAHLCAVGTWTAWACAAVVRSQHVAASPTSLSTVQCALDFDPCRYRTGVTWISRDIPKRFAGEGLRGHTSKSCKHHTSRHSAQHATFHLCTFFSAQVPCSSGISHFRLAKKVLVACAISSSFATCTSTYTGQTRQTPTRARSTWSLTCTKSSAQCRIVWPVGWTIPTHRLWASQDHGNSFSGRWPWSIRQEGQVFALRPHQPVTTHLYPHPTNVGKNAMKVASQLLMQERDASDARWRVYRSSGKDSMYPAAGDMLRENLLLS